MTGIPKNLSWHRLALALTRDGVKSSELDQYQVSDSLLYQLRKGGNDANPTWNVVLSLWSAAEAKLTLEQINRCCIEPDARR